MLRLALPVLLLAAAASGFFPVSVRKDDQLYPAVSFDGDNFLVTWHDTRDMPSVNVYACRVSTDGRALDTAGIRLAGSQRDQLVPRVVHSTQDWFVIYQEGC